MVLVNRSVKHNDFSCNYQVTAIGGNLAAGSVWWLTQEEAIEEIESGKNKFYVDINGLAVSIVVAKVDGAKYLKSELDGEVPILLLALPDLDEGDAQKLGIAKKR